MDWTEGIRRALDYIEDNLTGEIDYERAAREAASSSYHFQRVFGILTGFTLGEYIRNRRLALAGAELASGRIRVIDAALKYGYESPDSFARAFRKFHGVNPSDAAGASLRSFSPLRIKLTLEGANIMDYKIQEKPRFILTGFKRRFEGTPVDRRNQDYDMWINTRVNQSVLQGMAPDRETMYEVIRDQRDDGYDFYIAWELDPTDTEDLAGVLNDPEFAARFEKITVPAGLYLVCETGRSMYPTQVYDEFRKNVAEEILPGSGYELDDRPEVVKSHWYYRYGDEKYNSSRYMELWLPVVRK